MLETQDGANFLPRKPCRDLAAKAERFTRPVLILHRLGHCRRVYPVVDVVVKVKP